MAVFTIIVAILMFTANAAILGTDLKKKRIPNLSIVFLLILAVTWHVVLRSGWLEIRYGGFAALALAALACSFALFWTWIWSAGDAKYLFALSLFASETGEMMQVFRNVAIATVIVVLGHTAIMFVMKRKERDGMGKEAGYSASEDGKKNIAKSEALRFLFYCSVTWAFWLWQNVDYWDPRETSLRAAAFLWGYFAVRLAMRALVGAMGKTEIRMVSLKNLKEWSVIPPRFVKKKWAELHGGEKIPQELERISVPLEKEWILAIGRHFASDTEIATVKTHAFSPIIFLGFLSAFVSWNSTMGAVWTALKIF